MRTQGLKDLPGALTKAKENELAESFDKIQKKDPESTTAINVAEKLSREDSATCS